MINESSIIWQIQLLRLFCEPAYLEEIEGDLLEQFEKRTLRNQPAKWLLWIDILKLLRPKLIKSIFNYQRGNNMLKHNIKVSLRNFNRHRTSFLINYLGLVGGLVTVLAIYLWVNHEMNVDSFHDNGEHIYRLVSDNGGSTTLLNTNAGYAKELEASIPEIEYIVNSAWGPLVSNLLLEEEAYPTRGEFGTERFFELFTYPLVYGDPSTVFDAPNAIILSEGTALRLFNKTDVVGRRLEWRWYSHEEPVVVSGVYKDLPSNSSAQFDYVLNFKVYENRLAAQVKNGRNARTYLKLVEGASAEAVNAKIHDHTKANYPEFEDDPYFVINYADYYLVSEYENGKPVGGRIALVCLFIAIGGLILIIACVNFMNLSTARAALRTKEIGVRKAMGALRKSLIFQFLTEACMISLMAGITASLLLVILLPTFENLLGQQLHVSIDLGAILVFMSFILLTGLISGSYPALYLSNFSPLKVLKGSFTASSKDQWFRKGLVVFQFGISLILIIAVLVIYQQMRFVQTKSLGYQNEFIINFRTTGMDGQKQRAFLSEVKRLPGVTNAAGISHALFGAQKSGSNMSWEGKDPEQEVWFEYGNMGYNMLELLEIKLVEGRSFSKDYGDESSKVIINQATKNLMEVEQAVGEKFTVNNTEYEIIGVTDDFHFQSLHKQIGPTFFLLNNHDWYLKLAIKIEPSRLHDTLAEIDKVYSQINPGFQFDYSFHDQDQAKMYTSEEKMSLLTKYAAGLAIIISSLGLFGLMSFVTERRSKEMGIRKILGAPSGAIIQAVSRDFIVPIVVASVVGTVAAAFLVNQWLDGFAYRVALKWWFFAGAILLMILIAVVTSASQITKAVLQNPIKALRDE